MDNRYDRFLKINFDGYSAPEYFDKGNKERFVDSVIRMLEMQKLIRKSIEIAKTAEIPLKLIEGLNDIIDDYSEKANLLGNVIVPKDHYSVTAIFDQIHNMHANFFEISSSNKTLMTINAISNYENFFDSSSIKKINDLTEELNDKNKTVDGILAKLKQPSAEKVLSDYANEYALEEIKNIKNSRLWLSMAVILTSAFIVAVFCSMKYEWFPTTLNLKSVIADKGNSHEVLNLPVLISKVMLFSIGIYFIIFCFRQYSINRHLAVVNQQRKNAFNSYILFDSAIGEKDSEARKTLLMSLARTIHESINTGFLSSKQSDQALIQNVDLGKITSGIIK